MELEHLVLIMNTFKLYNAFGFIVNAWLLYSLLLKLEISTLFAFSNLPVFFLSILEQNARCNLHTLLFLTLTPNWKSVIH